MKLKESLRDFTVLIIVVGLILLFNNFILSNLLPFVIAVLFFGANFFIIESHERRYKENFPYKPYKSKKKIVERILIGLSAGFHYTFFIWSYEHKKYNTQVNYPETLECFFGNISQLIIFSIYIFISVNIFRIVGYYSLLFMSVPIVTNIINIIIILNKKR